MDLIHIGLVSSSEETADRFFGELLGLEKTRKSRLPREVTKGLFGVDQDCEIAYYGTGSLVFEVFLTGWSEPKERRISHTCIEVADHPGFLARCREMGYELREVPKGDKVIVFLADTDGNLFEIIARPA